jgi:N-acetylneuraminic acid mutarotase
MMGINKSLMLLLVFILLSATGINIAKPASSIEAKENFWTELAPIQPKFYYTYGAAVVNGAIYFMGSDINEQYNPQTNTWTSKTPPPIFFGYVAAVTACQNKIHIIGRTAHMVYDPAIDTWENRTPMTKERYTNDANVIDEKIYVISGGIPGFIAQYFTSSANEVYDPENDSWTELEPIPTPVSGYASAILDNKIYIIGGRKEGVGPPPPPITLVQIYDPKTNKWTEGTPLEQPVAGAAAIATTGLMAPKRIYVIGGDIIIAGNHLVQYSDHNQIYDPQTESWDFGVQMPTGRSSLALVNVDDTLYALGGTNKTVYGITVPGDASEEEWEAAYDKIASQRTHANERYTPIGYIPEFPSWTPLLIALIAVVAVTVIYRRKLSKANKRRGTR